MSSDLAIQMAGLSKQYRLGQIEPYRTLRDSIANACRRLARRSSGNGADESTFWALKDVSLEITRGEVIGIIGRNGAGKSTLLKILSRITEPTQGVATLCGRVGSLLEVGTGFHPELTGRENIFLNGAILGMTRAEIRRRFDEIVEFAEIERFLDTPVKRYSSGMYVRLAFAVAAHLEAEILIVDEVLAVGDQAFQSKCLDVMNSAAKSGRTILFVSHNMAAIESLCSSAILLESGRIIARGAVDEVVGRYLAAEGRSCYDIDLTSHPGRLRGMNPVLTRLRLLDDLGKPLSHVELGRPVTFEIHASPLESIRDAAVAIHISSSIGQRVVTYHSRIQSGAPISLAAGGIIRCRTPQCQLVPGAYTIVLGLDSGAQTVDRIESGLQFEVIARDLYGTGRTPTSRQGVFAPLAQWRVGGDAG